MRSGLPSSTALFTLSARAAETRRPTESRLIDDPFAAIFLSQLGVSQYGLSPLSWMVRQGGMAAFVAIRHRIMDDLFLEAYRGGYRQVVNLGCGFDSRLFRFKKEFSDGAYFEVDHPSSFRLKSYLLNCDADRSWEENTRRISIDFESE
ncbi:MAG: SAM-dependent methyltransferase, partial [Planctomycetota bacterium]|nr:SAM-dependent methyltransferase [Planctomycetota bacterium]